MDQEMDPDPTIFALEQRVSMRGKRNGTMVSNGITFTNFNEIEWRKGNNRYQFDEFRDVREMP